MEQTTEIPVRRRKDGSLSKIADVARRLKDEYSWPVISLLGSLRPIHHWMVGRLAKIEKGEKVLEVGSGYPLYKMYSGRVGENGIFVSLDINDNIQRRSRNLIYWFNKSLKRGLSGTREAFVVADAEKLPFVDRTFDVVMANNFTGDQDSYVKEAFRVLKPGGRFINACMEPLVPIYNHKIARIAREVGFTEVKIRPGAPGFVTTPGTWNWNLEASKPAF